MLVEVSDITARTGLTYEGTELTRVESFITDVSALFEGFLKRIYTPPPPAEPIPVPAAVKAIACTEVIRMLNTDPGIAAERIGELSTQYGRDGGGLSEAVKEALRPYRSGGLTSVKVTCDGGCCQ